MIDAFNAAFENLTKRIRNLEAAEDSYQRYQQLTNGGFEICQRTGPFTVSGDYTLDRWIAQAGGTTTFSVSQDNTTLADGSTYSVKLDITKGDTNFRYIQYLENIEELAGRSLTFAAEVYSAVPNTVRLCIFDYVTGYIYNYSDYHTGDSTWQKLTVTRSMLFGASLIGVSIEVEATQVAYVDNAILSQGVKTPVYAPLHPFEEWSRCKRYYEISTVSANLYSAGDTIKIPVTFSVQKACIPTVDLSDGAAGGVCTGDDKTEINEERFIWHLTVSGAGNATYEDRQYIAICNPEVIPVAPFVYFSPGAANAAFFGELWKVSNGVASLVHTFAEGEIVTCIFWSQINSKLYVCTWSDWTWLDAYIYQVVDDVVSLVATIHDESGVNPIAEAAEFGSYIYLHCGYFMLDPYVVIRKFDPVAGTESVAYTYPNPAYGGGIAVDEVDNKLIAYSGYDSYRSTDGTVWNHDYDLNTNICSVDRNGLITHPVGGRVYLANQPFCLPAMPGDRADILKRTGDGAWSTELVTDSARNGTVSITPEYTSGGVEVALYCQRWAWDLGPNSAEIWKKPNAGAWALDYSPMAGRYIGLCCQSMAYNPYDSYLYAMWEDNTDGGVVLMKRDSLGNWTTVQTWTTYYPHLDSEASGVMALAPNTLRKCHQV